MNDNETGYCKPPKKHQFKKGKSGNPRGRPRKALEKTVHPSEAAILQKIYDETVVIEGKKMTKRELELRVLQKKALSGNIPAMKLLKEIAIKAGLAGGQQQRKGVLRLPPKVSEEEWEKQANENQAPYRENRRDDKIKN